jgi:hypothetical protein
MGTGIGPCAQEPIPKRHRRAREFRSQRVELLADESVFTLAWLPGPFIPASIAAIALERIHRALTPGGWLIFGLHPQPPSALGQALANLRMVRGGGHPWTTNEVEQRLNAHGFERIEALSPFPPIMFVLGQRPVISDRTKIVD